MVKKTIKATYLFLLKLLAKVELLKNSKALVIGITGSSGKTSCKDTVVAFLAPHAKNALKYTKKGNSETGIPYEILDIPVRHYKIWEYLFVLLRGLMHVLFTFKKYDIFVIEYGIDGPNSPLNMDYLLGIVRPSIAILLSVSSVHGEKFDPVVSHDVPEAKRVQAVETAIAREKFKLLQAVPNKKNAYITKQAAAFLKPEEYTEMTVLEEVTHPAMPTITNTTNGVTVTFGSQKGTYVATIPELALPSSATLNFHFAAILVTSLKKDLQLSLQNLSEYFHLDPGRSSLLPGHKGTIILDSSYNANPYAAKELFPLVKELAKSERRKKIIVLGDFRELGSTAPAIYANIIKDATKVADILILTNDSMREYGIPAAEQAGFVLNENLYWFTSGKQLSYHINEMIEPNAVVLFEGSQNTVFLEYAVKELCANQDPDYIKAHIPRMSNDWMDIK